MAEGVDEDDFYQRVVDAIRPRFVSDADPVAILDVLLEKEYIDHDMYRDISELRLTSEKNRQIIEIVRSKGKKGYIRFKDYLRSIFHEHIVEYMERKEKEVKPRMKKTRIQKPRNTRHLSDQDLLFFGSTIGRNWELLGPLLGLTKVEIDHLKMNNATVELQIYNMLQKWKQNVSADGSSLEELMFILSKAPTSIHIDYDCINRHFQRASGDVHPVSKRTPSDEPGRATGSVEQPMLTHSYSKNTSREHETTIYQRFPPPNGESHDKDDQASSKFQETRSNDMLCKTFAVDQVDALGTISAIPVTTSANFVNLDTNFIGIESENRPDMENENRPVQENDVSNQLQVVIDVLQTIKTSSSMQGKQYSSGPLSANVPLSTKIEVDYPEDSFVCDTLDKKFKVGQDKPKRDCVHDGRLLILDKTLCEQLKEQCNHTKTMKGGFGSVYLSDKKISEYINIKIALKEIKCDDNNKHYKRSITNEQLASRVMHFAIVPLLGMGVDQDNRINWFLSPRLDRGDLFTLIAEDTKLIEEDSKENIQLDHKRRLKILYHIAAAIHFLHTEITHFRGSVIHLDVKTRNVVLDGNYNARLTDFGVARETPENKDLIETSQTAIPVSEGYFEIPVLGQLHKYFDYFNIGVVILELLTGKPPLFYESGKEVMLKNLDDDCIDFYIQDEIWNDNAPVGKRLKQLLGVCMDSAKGGDSLIKEKSTSMYILEESQKLIEHCGGMTWERVASLPLDHDKCEMCMVNPSVPNDLFSHQNCLHPLYVCVSCMRNSYLNPLLCHSCLQEIDPLIGGNSGAVLVAGQYDNEKLTDLCAENVRAVEETITSKCPLVMGIRPDNVKRLPSLEVHLSPADQIRKAYSEFKEKGLKTVFFYFSGRYSKKTGFVLRKKIGESDIQSRDKDDHRNNMALSEFKEILQSFLDDTESDDKVIVILDCQEAPLLNFDETKTKMKIVQLNSCKPDQKHNQDARCKSLFTKAFLQGLKATSKNDCDLHEDGKPCTICPIEGQDFITIGNMNTYISRHMVLLEGETAKPVQNATSDMKIAYLVDSSDKLSFTLTFEGKLKDCEIACSYFNNINQLKEVLFDKFMEQMKVDKEKGGSLELKANEFCHILGIFYKRGPKDSHKVELFTLEQVMSAWNGKRQLYVEMREMSTIDKGMVGVFRYEKNKNYFLFIENWEYGMDEEDTDKTVFKIDIETFIAKNKKTNMKNLSLELNKIRVAVRPAELHIVIPVVTDEHGTRHQRDDFLCYKIERLSKINPQSSTSHG